MPKMVSVANFETAKSYMVHGKEFEEKTSR